jgi:hypothetical protein
VSDLDVAIRRLTGRVSAVEAENRRLRLALIGTRARGLDAMEMRIGDRSWSIAEVLQRLPLAPLDVLDSIERALDAVEVKR